MIGTTLNFKPNRRIKLSSTDIIVLFILLSFIIGFAIGVFLISGNNSVFLHLAENGFKKLFLSDNTSNFWAQALNAILRFLPFMAFSFLFGTCILGCALIPAVCVIKGISDGLIVAYVYNTYAISGMGFTVLILAPYIIICAYALVLAGRESLCFSDRILRNTLPKGTSYNLSGDFKIYCIRYIFIFVLAIFAAVLNSILKIVFLGYFNL